MASTLVFTSSVEMTARREAAEARRESARERAFGRVLAMVREEGEWFDAKIVDDQGKWRVRGWSAERIARMILDPETDVEYWPAA